MIKFRVELKKIMVYALFCFNVLLNLIYKNILLKPFDLVLMLKPVGRGEISKTPPETNRQIFFNLKYICKCMNLKTRLFLNNPRKQIHFHN